MLITKARLHIRGMNRNTVIVDGTKPGSAVCSRKGSAQNFGLPVRGGKPSGANGLMVYKARDVSIENLTACNFLGGSQDAGNEIWWNGGADSGKVGGYGYYGAYLSTTSSYLKSQSAAGEFSAAQYGVFSSNWSGRDVGPHLRLELQRLGLLHRRLPAGLQPDDQPRVTPSTTRSATRGPTRAASC